jgi:hypothetical protein
MDKLDINLLFSNASLYERKVQMDFETYFFIFFKLDNFKISFEILRTSSIPIVRKMTLYSEIILQLGETIYARVDYTGLPKGRSFIIIEIYPIASNAILNSITSKIAILANPTKKALKIDKGIYIAKIHECADIAYFMVSNPGMLVVLITVLTTISELLSSI